MPNDSALFEDDFTVDLEELTEELTEAPESLATEVDEFASQEVAVREDELLSLIHI